MAVGIMASAVHIAAGGGGSPVVDASTPARFFNNDGIGTSALFTAPSSALLVACVTTNTITHTVYDSGGLTWAKQAGTSKATIWTAVTSSAVARTVTADDGESGFGGAIGCKVYVLTSANIVSPVGAIGSGTSSTNNFTASVYTSTVDNSLGIGCAADFNNRGIPTSTDVEDGATLVDHSPVSLYKATPTTPSGTVVTMNFDGAGADATSWIWSAIEVVGA